MLDAATELKTAISHHQAGRFEDAETGYRAVLAGEPDNADALHLLGLIAHHHGNNEKAVDLIKRAMAVKDQTALYYCNLGGVLRAMCRTEEAVSVLNQAAQLDANNADTRYNLGLALMDLEKPQEAIAEFRKALRIRPKHAQTHGALADALTSVNNMNDAIKSYEACLKIDSRNSVAQYNLGNAHTALGKPEQAAACFEKTIALRPNFAEAYNNLGIAKHMMGNLEQAQTSYKSALEHDPNYAPAHDNLGITMQELGRLDDAIESHRAALKLRPDIAVTHNNLGNALRQRGKIKDAIASFERAVAIDPDYVEAKHKLRSARCRLVPGWHAPMLADELRNDAYQAAIEKAITAESRVLDIGTGSGLLSLMAARAGAQSILACEVSEVIAKVAREVVAANGYDKKITVVNKKSTQLQVGEDLPVRANVLVSEILGSGLLNEGVLPSHRHAKQQLLTPDAVVIPARATLFGALVEMPRRRSVAPMREISGFDLSAFDQLRDPTAFNVVDLENEPHTRLCDVVELARYDFRNPAPLATWNQPAHRNVNIEISADGAVHGVAYWFALHLDDEITVHSGPGGELKHWQQAVQFFEQDLPVTRGDRFAIDVQSTDLQIGFSLRRNRS